MRGRTMRAPAWLEELADALEARRDATRWWPLYPGTNTIRMTQAEGSETAETEIRWADAYL